MVDEAKLPELREAIRLTCFGHPVDLPYAENLKAIIGNYDLDKIIQLERAQAIRKYGNDRGASGAEYFCLGISRTHELLRIAKELGL